jgi:hypothetical protein
LNRWRTTAIIYIFVTLALGFYLASQINSFLAIEFNPKTLPEVPTYHAEGPEDIEPIDPVVAISIPPGAMQDELYRTAIDDLTTALETRIDLQPQIIAAPADLPPGNWIAIGSRERNELVEVSQETVGNPEGFAFQPIQHTSTRGLAVAGGSRIGDVYGVYHLIRALYSDTDIFSLEKTIVPALPYRFVDMGAVGIPFDPAGWDPQDYSHHDHAYEDVILPTAPYIDEDAFKRVENEFKAYLHRMISYGNNGIVFNGFLEFVNFDQIGDGFDVYPAGSDYRDRHLALRAKFGPLFAYAHEMGMSVILKTDMVALTKPLEAYFDSRFGGVDVSNSDVWDIYQAGLEELFASMPYVDGIMIRIGEAGAIYNLEGWDYYSQLYVRSDESVKTMLQTFLQVAEIYDKKLLFRTWSVGVGEVGDIHTNPTTYRRVLGDLNSPNLILSTKYAKGDYYSYLPLNPTLRVGEQSRIIEFQARREFEAFNAFPNYVGPLYQTALVDLHSQNPKIEGIWLWTQGGGPPRAGPLSLYPFHGFWLPIDANVYVTSRLAWDLTVDLESVTKDWVRQSLSADPESVYALTELFFLSPEAMLKGLYIAEFGKQQVLAMGLEPPPNMWIFEWDIISGSSASLVPIYVTTQDHLDAAIEEGFQAVQIVQQMQNLLAGAKPQTLYDQSAYTQLKDSLDYEENLFQTLAWYRKSFLNLFHWLDTGDPGSYQAWQNAYEEFKSAQQDHLNRYEGDLNFPAYNFFAVEAGMAHAERSVLTAWLGRILLALTIAIFAAGTSPIQRWTGAYPGKAGLRALWTGLTAPWGAQMETDAGIPDRLMVTVLPGTLIVLGFITFSSLRSPHFVGWMALSLLGFTATLMLVSPQISRKGLALPASIFSPLLLVNAIFMAVVAVRGSWYFWLRFWTSPVFRDLFISLSLAAGLWLFFTVFTTLRESYAVSRLSTLGNLMAALGVMLVINGLLGSLIGLDPALASVNNEMAVLPLALSKILGITTHLGIPPDLPFYAAGFGAVLVIIAAALSASRRAPVSTKIPRAREES